VKESGLANNKDTNVPEDESTVPEDESTVPEDESTVPEDKSTVPEDESTVPEDKSTVPEDENSNVPEFEQPGEATIDENGDTNVGPLESAERPFNEEPKTT
jgi:hypothetical protein